MDTQIVTQNPFLEFDKYVFEIVLSFLDTKSIHSMFKVSMIMIKKFIPIFRKYIHFHKMYKWLDCLQVSCITVTDCKDARSDFSLLNDITKEKNQIVSFMRNQRIKKEHPEIINGEWDNVRKFRKIEDEEQSKCEKIVSIVIDGDHYGKSLPVGIKHIFINGQCYVPPHIYDGLETFVVKKSYCGPRICRQDSLKRMEMDYGALRQETISQNIEILKIYSFSDGEIHLPPNIREVELEHVYEYNIIYFPYSIRKISILSIHENSTLNIPGTCEELEIRSGTIRGEFIVPLNLKKLVLTCKFNVKLNLPEGLEVLILGDTYDCAFLSFPKSLRVFKIGNKFDKKLRLGPNMVEVSVGKSFNSAISFSNSGNLKKLELFSCYTKSILTLPEGLEEFQFNPRYDIIILDSVPKSLKFIKLFSNHFTNNLPKGNYIIVPC